MQEKKVYTSVVFSKNYLPMRRKFEEWFNVQHNVCPGPSRLVCPKQTQVPAHKAGSRQSMGRGEPHWAAKWIATNTNQPNITKEYIKTISGWRGNMESFWARPIQCFFTVPCRPLIQTEISDRISFWIHGSLIQSCVEWRALHVTVEGLSDLFKWVLLQPFIVRLVIHHILDDMPFCNSSQNNPPIMFYSNLCVYFVNCPWSVLQLTLTQF